VKNVGGVWRVIRPFFTTTGSSVETKERLILDAGAVVQGYMTTDVSDSDTQCIFEFDYELIDTF
jgi:hypothetical protein